MSRDEDLLELSEYPNDNFDDTDDDNDRRGSDDDDEDTHEHSMNERESLHDDNGEYTYSRPSSTPRMEEFYVDSKYLDDGDDRYDYYSDYDDGIDEDYKDDDQQVSEDDSGDDDHLYMCMARYKGHIPCREIFTHSHDILTHLKNTHKTGKWLVSTFVRIDTPS